jgi:hypothetical protein
LLLLCLTLLLASSLFWLVGRVLGSAGIYDWLWGKLSEERFGGEGCHLRDLVGFSLMS